MHMMPFFPKIAYKLLDILLPIFQVSVQINCSCFPQKVDDSCFAIVAYTYYITYYP